MAARHARRRLAPTSIVAGGMESMTNAPYLMKKHRAGARIGHDTVYRPYDASTGSRTPMSRAAPMGTFAEDAARDYQFTRERAGRLCDRVADAAPRRRSKSRRVRPRDRRRSRSQARKGAETVDEDEQPGKGDPAKIPGLKPAFAKDGTITAANASSHLATAPPRWSSPARASPTGSASSRSPGSSPTPPTPTSRPSSPPPRSRRDAQGARARPAGTSATSTSTRSTRPSPASP